MSRRRRSTSSKRSETRSMRGVISSRKGPYFALVVALLLTGYTYVRLKSLDRGCVVTGSGARDTDGYYAAPADFYNRPEAPSFSRARVAFTAVPDVFALAQLPAAVAVARGGTRHASKATAKVAPVRRCTTPSKARPAAGACTPWMFLC